MKYKYFMLLLCLLLLMSSCTQNRGYDTKSYYNMDTVITIQLPHADNEKAFSACGTLIGNIDNDLSKTVAESEISKCNRTDASFTFTDNTASLLQTALDVSVATNGAFSLSIAPLSYLWKDVFQSAQPMLPDAQKIESAKQLVDDRQLSLNGTTLTKNKTGMQIELGGCAKGYACEQAVACLKQYAAYGYVSFGGNIGVFGAKPDGSLWNIGIKDAAHPDALCGSVKIKSGFVSVSGDYERYADIDGTRYHHIIDPKTGYPAASALHSVAVVSENGTLADALSTALFVLGYDQSMALYLDNTFDFEAIFTLADGTIQCTPGIKDAFTPAG